MAGSHCTSTVWADSLQADFEEKYVEHNISGYVENPNPTYLYLNRKLSHLSSFFWKDTGVIPQANLSGLANVVTLQQALLNGALDTLGNVLDLNNLTVPIQQIEMHDYRKRLRAITSVATMMPLWPSSKNVTLCLNTVSTAYDGLGDTEDRISAYEYELKHGNAVSIGAAEVALESEWLLVEQWLGTGALGVALQSLLQLLIVY